MRFLLRKATFLLVLLSALGTGALARAATTEPAAIAEEFTLSTGAVFEIYADHDIADPSYNWTLLLDETFLQAGRNQWFRTRLIQPGNYLLTGEVRNADGSKRYRKTLLMHVQENVPQEHTFSAGSGVLVRTNPAADASGRVILTSSRSVLQLLPVSDSQEAFVLDLQKTVDANGDGNFQNDQVAENTFFSEQHTPLHLWFTEPVTRRVVTVSLRGRVGTEQEIAVVSPEQAVQEDKDRETERQRMEEERARILVTHFGSGAVKFSTYIEHEPYRRDPLLLHWNFGDGHQSLLDAPIHAYAANNVYTVRVGIRNLRTGGEIAQLETSVDVRSIAPLPPPTDPTEQNGANGGEKEPSVFPVLLSTVLRYGVGILLAIAIGFFATLLIRFLRRKGGVSTLLDRAEATLTDNDQKEESPGGMQPMSFAIDNPEVQEAAVIDTTVVDTAPPPPQHTPVTKEEQPPPDLATAEAPPWLQQGIKQQAATTGRETRQEPIVPPVMPMPQEPAAQEPVLQEPAPVPPPPEENGTVPLWLQQPAPAPAVETTASTAQDEPPAPTQPPLAAPADTTPPPPTTSETIDTANAPDWLQQGIQKAQQEGQTPSSPPPPELQEPPPAPEPAAPAATVEPLTTSVQSPEQKQEPAYHIPPEQWAAMTPGEREQELRRQKRRRYRQNRKIKEKEQSKTGASPTLSDAAPAVQAEETMPQEAIPTAEPPPASSSPAASDMQKMEEGSPADIGEPIPPAEGEDAVKFVIGADSLNASASEESEQQDTGGKQL
ncbi:MAG: hypothetical protein PHU04_01585 [Candidatus Peribacteraceae bacterium]|nr:hypothetical protein [Candidatus Peribacteraceae bacterium]